jgi:head-tail adaptor
MKAGRLRQRVTIQYKVMTKDTVSQESITWTEGMYLAYLEFIIN